VKNSLSIKSRKHLTEIELEKNIKRGILRKRIEIIKGQRRREIQRNKDNSRYRDDEDVGRRTKDDRHKYEDKDVKGRKSFDTKKRKNDESDEETG